MDESYSGWLEMCRIVRTEARISRWAWSHGPAASPRSCQIHAFTAVKEPLTFRKAPVQKSRLHREMATAGRTAWESKREFGGKKP